MAINEQPKSPHHPAICPRCRAATERLKPFCPRCALDLRHGTPKRVTTGKCRYCNFTGELSAEHIFGHWLQERYPHQPGEKRHELARPEEYKFWEFSPFHRNTEKWHGGAYTEVVHNVCAPCNNGWMSVLQDQAKPIVSRLADGYWPSLTNEETQVLSRWTAMVAINLETKARILTTHEHQLEKLKSGEMPPGFRVTIGRMVSASHRGYSFVRQLVFPVGMLEDDHLTVQSAFFCIENVVFHTMSSFGDCTLNLAQEMIPYIGLPRQVWPINHPPRISNRRLKFTPQDLDRIQRQTNA